VSTLPLEGDRVQVETPRIWTTERFDGERFWTRENGKRVATPLFLALVLVEFTDVVFALDSIPAIFAITPFPLLC
jgi:tellurite resistance protein TerC